jgi:glycosyltransferase involved in cell wall biosynthesis
MWRYAPWLYDSTERWLLRTLDRVFCVRRSAVQRYTKDYPSIADRFEFIPTWVDTDVFMPVASKETARASVLAELGVDNPARLLTWVGRLDHSKDPLLLVEAFRIARGHTPDLHLVIVGDGVLRKRLDTVCSSDELRGHVSLVGARRSPEIARFLHASELFVMSSAYEGMPIALLEALATGTPAVTTDVGEVRLVIQEGVNGYVATPRTPEALGNAIRRAVDEAHVLGGLPCTRAVEPYRPELVLQRIYETHRREGGAAKGLHQPARAGGVRSSG